MWWYLHLDDEITIDTAPGWAGGRDWRDHWMQAVFFLPKAQSVEAGQAVTLTALHDDYTIWFDLDTQTASGADPVAAKSDSQVEGPREIISPDCERPICVCGGHVLYNTNRIWMLNDERRNSVYMEVLRRLCQNGANVLKLVTISWHKQTDSKAHAPFTSLYTHTNLGGQTSGDDAC
eukprot:m.244046 g.244046  ORF g.244046 m.244046 type:complete len:177 (-) comp19030_c0_seq18:42-572(-)